jgi:hypothetical protein
MSKFRRHSLITGLVILAGGVPAAAQARVDINPSAGMTTPVPIAAPSSAALAQAARQTQPVEQPAAVQAPVTNADSGFHWDDAGIGAGGAIVVLGAASGIMVAVGRRRRTDRPLAG